MVAWPSVLWSVHTATGGGCWTVRVVTVVPERLLQAQLQDFKEALAFLVTKRWKVNN